MPDLTIAPGGVLHVSRALLLSFATVIVPGHGAAFRPGPRAAR